MSKFLFERRIYKEKQRRFNVRRSNTGGRGRTIRAETRTKSHYQAVEKEGVVTAIWEMQGQKHLRTIDPRSAEGKQILALFETAG